MWRKIYIHPAFALAGAVSFVFGIPGMIDHLGGWQEWWEEAPWWFGFLSGVGAAMVIFWAIHVCGPTAGRIYKWIVVRRAYLARGNGTHIAKLIQKTRSVEIAMEIFEIFDGSSEQRRVAHAYASYAQALVRFDFSQEATAVLMALNKKDIPDIEIEEAKDCFFYLQDDGEPTNGLADRIVRKEKQSDTRYDTGEAPCMQLPSRHR